MLLVCQYSHPPAIVKKYTIVIKINANPILCVIHPGRDDVLETLHY